jgi:phosphate-selective porin
MAATCTTRPAHACAHPEAGLTDIRYVDSGALVTADQIRRTGLEGIWIRGPFSLQAEALRATVTRNDGKPDYTGSGQYAMASWVLTGESRPYNAGAVANIKPAHTTARWNWWPATAAWTSTMAASSAAASTT